MQTVESAVATLDSGPAAVATLDSGPAARADLDRFFVSGIAWTSVVTWLSQIVSWGSTLVVVHYLAPTDYGLVGMALLYLGIVQMASELGLGAAVVRYRDLTSEQIAQFNALSVIAGACGVLLSMIVAVPMGHFFREPRLPPVVVVMSLAFFISGFRIVPQALMQKRLEFKKLALIEGTQSLIGAVCTLVMAVAGFGYWTLALGMVITSTIYSALVVANTPTGFRRPQFAAIRQPFTFSSHMLITRFAWYGYDNADFAVIGRVLGTQALGAYTIGWTLSGMAVEKITALIGRVTPAFFSAVQTDLAELRRYLLVLTEGLALLTFPASIGLALTAEEIVRVALGEKWAVAIVPLRLLAILATIKSVSPLIPQVLAAIGEARTNMRISLMTLVVLPTSFLIATRWGIAGVAVAWLVLGPVMLAPLMIKAFRLIEMPATQYFRALWPATSACIVMTISVMLVDRLFLGHASLAVALAAKIGVGAASYVAAMFGLHHQRIAAIRQAIPSLRRKSEPAPVNAAHLPPVTSAPTASAATV
jgi:PST family polysaccharide transporter